MLVDLEAGRPIDLLVDRTAANVEAWLKAHPGAQVIVRDRSTEYARGVSRGASDALQVLDRHAKEVRQLAETGEGVGPPRRRRSAAKEASRAAVRQRTAERHAEIKRLVAAGGTLLGIARQVRTSRTTVRRYLFADVPSERDYAPRPSTLDPYAPYRRRRWAEGCRHGLQRWPERKEQGYPGASRAVSRWAELRREIDPSRPRAGRPRATPDPAGPEPPAPPRRRSPARLAWLLVRNPGGLNDEDLTLLTRFQAVCPPAARSYPLLQEIARLIKERSPERLDGWLERAARCGVPDLVTFAEGQRRERAEFLAALELPTCTGPVEGQITRLTLLILNGQGYGHYGLETLKRRLLHVA